MLDDVLVRLRELGLLKDENAAHCNVFVRLDNVLVNVFDDDGRYYYLRMAEAYDMQREYDVARSVAEVVGRFVPQPLAFFRIGKLSCMVAEGVDFEIVTGAALLDATSSTPAVRELLAFVEYAAGALAARSGTVSNHATTGHERRNLTKATTSHQDRPRLTLHPHRDPGFRRDDW